MNVKDENPRKCRDVFGLANWKHRFLKISAQIQLLKVGLSTRENVILDVIK